MQNKYFPGILRNPRLLHETWMLWYFIYQTRFSCFFLQIVDNRWVCLHLVRYKLWQNRRLPCKYSDFSQHHLQSREHFLHNGLFWMSMWLNMSYRIGIRPTSGRYDSRSEKRGYAVHSFTIRKRVMNENVWLKMTGVILCALISALLKKSHWWSSKCY